MNRTIAFKLMITLLETHLCLSLLVFFIYGYLLLYILFIFVIYNCSLQICYFDKF